MIIPRLMRIEDAPPLLAHEQKTLRDFFAAAALTGLTSGLFSEIAANGMPQALALHAYLIADAMMKERAT